MAQVNNLSYSKSGLALTEQFEGLRLTAYQDSVGVWTIGYGHTGSDVHPGLTITQIDAESLLLSDVGTAARCVNQLVTIELSQNEFDALVDFVFNLGATSFAGSTLLRDLNGGNIAGAAGEFQKWDHAGGRVLAGLLQRRLSESTLFQSDASAAQDT
jgi:lysozyme